MVCFDNQLSSRPQPLDDFHPSLSRRVGMGVTSLKDSSNWMMSCSRFSSPSLRWVMFSGYPIIGIIEPFFQVHPKKNRCVVSNHLAFSMKICYLNELSFILLYNTKCSIGRNGSVEQFINYQISEFERGSGE